MSMKSSEKYILFFIAFVGFAAFLYWFFNNPVKEFSVNVPGADNRTDKDW
jgi:hypothetical protein